MRGGLARGIEFAKERNGDQSLLPPPVSPLPPVERDRSSSHGDHSLEANSAWSKVSSGLHHTGAVKTDNTLACWGENDLGELGDGTRTNRLESGAVN